MDQEQTRRSLLTIGGAILIFIGYFLPWYSIVFAPPQGFAIVNGQEVAAFTYGYSGLNESATIPGAYFHATMIVVFLVGLFNLIKLTLRPQLANRLIQAIAHFFHSKITGAFANTVQALTHVLISLLWIGFIFTVLIALRFAYPAILSSRLGGGADVTQAAHDVSIHFGIGLIFLLAGLIVSGLAVLKHILIVWAGSIVTLIILVVIHSPSLGPFLQSLGF